MQKRDTGYILVFVLVTLVTYQTTLASAVQSSALPTPPAPPSWLTLEVLDRLPLSGGIYLSTRATLLRLASTPAAGPRRVAGNGLGGWQPTPESFQSDTRLTFDSIKDAEPTVITRQKNLVNYTIVVAQKRPTVVNYTNYAHTRGSDGSSYDQELPLPQTGPVWSGSGYIDSGDSLLARANSDGIYVFRDRVYCVGTVNTGTAFAVPSGIALWFSDDGGVNWSSPSKVAENLNGTRYLDKPAIAVSQNIGTGYVYVVYLVQKQGGTSEIHMARSDDGGATFTLDTVVDDSGHIVLSPQILIDEAGGVVYVLWVDMTSTQIRLTYSQDNGQHWSSNVSVIADSNPNGSQFGGFFANARRLAHDTIAETVPMARFSSVSRKIYVTWHAFNPASPPNNDPDTDVFLATKQVDTGSWSVARVPYVDRTNDQLFPALDVDYSGKVLIAYYSRSEDPNNHFYRQKSVILKSSGSKDRAEEPALNDFNGSLPAELQYLTNANDPTEGGEPGQLGWVGDYHDVYYSPELGYFLSAWIAWPSATSPHYEVFSYGLH